MLRSCSIVFALAMTSCAGLRAPEPEVRAGLRGATDELIRRGELATAVQMLGASAEVTESELAQIYMLLAQAAEAKTQRGRSTGREKAWRWRSSELSGATLCHFPRTCQQPSSRDATVLRLRRDVVRVPSAPH